MVKTLLKCAGCEKEIDSEEIIYPMSDATGKPATLCDTCWVLWNASKKGLI